MKIEKMNEINDLITDFVQPLCGCDIESIDLVCDSNGDKTTVIYYAIVTDVSGIEYIEAWVNETDEIIVSGTKLTINTNCLIKIDKIDNTKCDASSAGQRSVDNNAAVVAVPIVLAIILIGVAVLMIAGFIYWKRKQGIFNIFG